MDVLERVPHGDDFEAGRFQLWMGQCPQDAPKPEVVADSFNGRRTDVQAGDIPSLLMHACQEGAATATEIKQPALTLPEDFHVAPLRFAPEAQAVDHPAPALPRGSMWPIDGRVETADAVRAGTWVREAETAPLALHHGEP